MEQRPEERVLVCCESRKRDYKEQHGCMRSHIATLKACGGDASDQVNRTAQAYPSDQRASVVATRNACRSSMQIANSDIRHARLALAGIICAQHTKQSETTHVMHEIRKGRYCQLKNPNEESYQDSIELLHEGGRASPRRNGYGRHGKRLDLVQFTASIWSASKYDAKPCASYPSLIWLPRYQNRWLLVELIHVPDVAKSGSKLSETVVPSLDAKKIWAAVKQSILHHFGEVGWGKVSTSLTGALHS